MNQAKHLLVVIWIYPRSQNSKPILNILNYKYNCLQLSITAWLHPAMDHATYESKYVINLIEARQQKEHDFAFIIRNCTILIFGDKHLVMRAI